MKKVFTTVKHQACRGFTLIELMVSVAIIGVLIAIFSPSTNGSTAKANLQMLLRTMAHASDNWIAVARQCDVSRDPADAALGNMNDLIFRGSVLTTPVDYTACYQRSAIRPLAEGVTKTGASTYSVAGYPVTLGGSSGLFTMTISNLSDEMFMLLLRQYDSSAATPADAATYSDRNYAYTAKSGGVRSFVLKKTI